MYEIFIDYEDDALEIVKTPSRQPVKIIEGKYGIILHQDINGMTVKITIPEPEVLFGVSIDHIQSFLINHSL